MSSDKQHVWQSDELEALASRGISLQARMDIRNRVRIAEDASQRGYVVKSMPNDPNERDALRKMLDLPSPRNHTVPCELIRCNSTALALMPALRVLVGTHRPYGSIDILLDFIEQMVEALDFMHEHKLVFGDFAALNLVQATDNIPSDFPSFNIIRGRYYLIDFGSSRSFPKGPGEGLLIDDWSAYPGHFDPPEGTEMVDPYAYDVYSLGETVYDGFRYVADTITFHPPMSLLHMLDMLRSPDPSLRPTMRQAVRIAGALRSWILATTWLYRYLPLGVAKRLDYCGWRLILCFV
ncbi:hypothetical protein OBBRIDRAFT_47167 [Obba rivulosa]|uniref:Protein kinase domain-containing protein n=1 Tax=Obba rivulosa TaxID=1052685 RepID=A0A8E2AQB5_9APHY|nr:hypothetical protein OBBRIDRAFT_47167 [Obba rivulosa]